MPNKKVETIKIGGVTFDKVDVKSSETILKDGKKINSVFLQDGTHIEFPNQAAKNQSSISQENYKTSDFSYGFGYNMRSGEFEPHLSTTTKEDPSRKVTNFNRMSGAKITGTEKEDSYFLSRCCDTTVDLSQNDGKSDYVMDKGSRTGSLSEGTRWKHENNTFKLGDSDRADKIEDSLFKKDHYYKGKGTYNTSNDNK